MVLFGFFALVLVSVYWVNRAVKLFDQLIANGHSAGVFLEFSALWLPAVIAKVMPMASFAAAVYVAHRLSADSEMVVAKSFGYSPWRLTRPVLAFGVIVVLMMSILTHVLVPKSAEQLRMREQELSGSVAARLLREGTFLHPSDGITFYIREITARGELRDVLLTDRRLEGRDVTYTAERAYLLRDDEGAKLVMLAGMAQTLDLGDNTLSTTNFTDLTYDISAVLAPPTTTRRRIQFVPTLELLTQAPAVSAETYQPLGRVLETAHLRFQHALLCGVAALVGFAAMMTGGYSRLGSTRQVIFAIFLIVCVKFVEGLVTDPVRNDASLWPITYLPSLVGAVITVGLLWQAARPYRPKRRPVTEAPA
ncbi:lipopolysaccharide export system permease protein [Tropicibacter naphthalenivorans]|uniref:Lipopolysaccharide ABC transporter permease n=2 Tax=Tropicibacter naphthalenivorans TaxID=441103 RepID=A0A0P1GF83_9RHOB|nr:lipopolysaccharide ABC transporter permease [Tropicibacter naphthalenivorans]SMC84864.1 lipopolysaccharide export system permease protein [Tropicibacter naphthalenivorans]